MCQVKDKLREHPRINITFESEMLYFMLITLIRKRWDDTLVLCVRNEKTVIFVRDDSMDHFKNGFCGNNDCNICCLSPCINIKSKYNDVDLRRSIIQNHDIF